MNETRAQAGPNPQEQKEALSRRLGQIKHKILVLSGKGGVGKSTVAANLAISLANTGKQVGLLDIDIHGPSIPKILGLEGRIVQGTGNTLIPVDYAENLKVISIGFLLPERDDAVIWRGPLKHHVIRQFLADVDWGRLDYLIIDSPPGTGDEPLSIAQLLNQQAQGFVAPQDSQTGAIIVTTPQEVALSDVRRCINFCRQVKMPVLGVVENMSGFVCPKCGARIDIFKTGGGEKMAGEMNVPFLGSIPIDPAIVDACDAGKPYIYQYAQSQTAKAFNSVIQPFLAEEPIKK